MILSIYIPYYLYIYIILSLYLYIYIYYTFIVTDLLVGLTENRAPQNVDGEIIIINNNHFHANRFLC